MNIQKIIGAAAFLLIALSMFACTEAAYGKPQWGQQGFQSGPRYGRAGGGHKKISSMRNIFAPRNERFELGTRYGKRSNLGEIAETLVYPVAAPSTLDKTLLCGRGEDMVCTHTGVANIYRCNQSYEEGPKDKPQRDLKD